jgi:hypothetical protein
MTSDANHPVRFPVAFRVGVTGARDLDPELLPHIQTAVAKVLETIRLECAAICADPSAKPIYASEASVPRTTVLSPLAEGADRVVAEAGLKSGYDLSVALPFPQAEYEKDFPDSVAQFRAMLYRSEGRVLALDGLRGQDEWRSYEAVGRLIVRNCDLLIAIWDNAAAPKGRGGTEDTIRFALRVGLPVWWIDAAAKRAPVLLEDDLPDLRLSDLPGDSEKKLQGYIRSRLMPPAKADRHTHGIFRKFIGNALEALGYTTDPMRDFLHETYPGIQPMWRAHSLLTKVLAWEAPRRVVGEQPFTM